MWTLACPLIHKPFAHELWLACLKRLDIPRKEFHLLILDFSYNEETNKLFEDYIEKHGKEYGKVTYLKDIKKKHENIVSDGAKGKLTPVFYEKRKSVAETMQIMNEHREGNVLLWEDDIIVPPNAWHYMKKVFDWSEDIWEVTGSQYSRQQRCPNSLLAWGMGNRKLFGNNDSSSECTWGIKKLEEKEKGFETIGSSASGFVLYSEEFLNNHDFATAENYGQDIMAGYHINQKGKYVMLCWEMKFPHLGLNGDGLHIYKSEQCKTYVGL